MYPMFGWTDSYPHLRNQMGYAPYPAASLESVAPHMKMEPARPSAVFEPWPYGSCYDYSYPTECHGCCNHSYFPSHYSFRPHYPHFPPLSPHHCHGSYHAFPGNYPVTPVHQIPPPHYSVEQPRYEYEKGHPADHHCCGCSNHSCRREPDKNVKIEEQEPDTVKKSSDPVDPSQLKNYPYPIVMIPPEYCLKNSEGRKSTQSEREGNGSNYDSSSDKISTRGSIKEKETQTLQGVPGQFPFPLFWLPHKPDDVDKEDLKEMNFGQQNFKDGNDEKMKISSSVEGPKMEKDASQVIVPMKKMEEIEEKKKDLERKVKAIPVEQVDDGGKVERSECKAKKQASSPKSSKLPPVCLRVDPVSKTKKSKGDSRSPSPPADKRRSNQSSNEDAAHLRQEMQSRNQVDKSEEVDRNKSETKTIKVAEGTTVQNKSEAQTKDHVPLFVSPHKVVSLENFGNECVNGAANKDIAEGKRGNEVALESQTLNKDNGKKMKRKLSDSEAAAIIQSAYRGYEVRKLETLQKLRRIYEISDKMAELKTRILAMEAYFDIQPEEKQLMAIGETIMSLLLKLDTIQGLHPSIRDVRKSVAKELVSLQEKLDSLISRKYEVPAVVPSPEPVVDPTVDVINNDCVPGNQNGTEVLSDNEALGSGQDTNLESENKCQANGTLMKNDVAGYDPLETSELISVVDSENREVPPVSSEDSQMAEPEPQLELEAQKNEVPSGHLQVTEVLADQECLGEDHSTEFPLPLSIYSSDSTVSHGERMIDNQEYGKTDEATRDDPIVVEVRSASSNESVKPNLFENADGNKENNKNVMEEARLEPEAMQGEPNEKEVSHTKMHAVPEEAQSRTSLDTVPSHKTNLVSSANNELPIHDKMVVLSVDSVEAKGGSMLQHDLQVDSVETSKPEDSVKAKEGSMLQGDLQVDSVETSKPEFPVNESVPQTEKGIFLPQATSETRKNDIASEANIGAKNAEAAPFESASVASQVYGGRDDTELMEENARLKEMMGKLIEAGNEQLATISKLSGKVKDLEKKLCRNKKPRGRRSRGKHQDVVLV